jgi:hypothetical protein
MLHTFARGLLDADADPWSADSMRGSFREFDVQDQFTRYTTHATSVDKIMETMCIFIFTHVNVNLVLSTLGSS